MRYLKGLGLLIAGVVLAACTADELPAAPAASSTPAVSTACTNAAVPAGTTLIARVCSRADAESLFVAIGEGSSNVLAKLHGILEGSTAAGPNGLTIPIPFDVGTASFLLVKYQVKMTEGRIKEEYGAQFFDGRVLVKILTDCPTANNPLSSAAGTTLSCPVSKGTFNQTVGTHPTYNTAAVPARSQTFPETGAVFYIQPPAPKTGPFGMMLTFGYVARTGNSTTALATAQGNRIVFIGV